MTTPNLPTNANASSCRCGNALPHTHTREYYTPQRSRGRPRVPRTQRSGYTRGPRTQRSGYTSTPGEAGGSVLGASCHFPAPAPRRIYCAPAPFTAPIGATHQLLVTAYGYSKPVTPVAM